MMELFHTSGIHAIVDGSFGSTGKGVLAYWLARKAVEEGAYFDGSIYSGGPNSGHTFYHEGVKHVNKQLPSTAVALTLITGKPAFCYLSAGAIIDPLILFEEAQKYPLVKVFVHPNAAIVLPGDLLAEKQHRTISEVAGTRSGTGYALMGKIARDPKRIWGHSEFIERPKNVQTLHHRLKPVDKAYFMEVAQGFSLGINQRFYPKVTSRECTVMQGLADACVPPGQLKRTYMSIRTFPIRVGNVDEHYSGDFYPDQQEITWEQLGVPEERTTVTNRVRRVATFSWDQFHDALCANAPDFVFANFLNYLPSIKQAAFVADLKIARPFGVPAFEVIEGYGPNYEDIVYNPGGGPSPKFRIAGVKTSGVLRGDASQAVEERPQEDPGDS